MAVLSLAPSLSAAEQACPGAGSASAKTVSVDERLQLTLDDGTKLKIAGVDPPRPTPGDPGLDIRARDALADWLGGRRVAFRPAEPGRDRWGRITAFVYAPAPQAAGAQGQESLSVGEALIDAGFGRYEPSREVHPCRDALLAAEAGARAARLGLWADPYYAILNPGEQDSLAEKTGSFVIVEGQVSGVSSRGPRITIYLGPRKGLDFSVTVLTRSSAAFKAAYPSLAGLTGSKIRARGLLDSRFGPHIEISDLDAVEITGQAPGAAAAPPSPH
jgi:endonuclease YncB( thermonuclease family)